MQIFFWPRDRSACESLLFDAPREDEARVRDAVLEIIRRVRDHGDKAALEYTRKFDGADITDMRVSGAEYEEAYGLVSPGLLETIRACAQNIRSFHEKQRRESWFTVSGSKTLGQLVQPLDNVGVYVPGGRAPYPSTVLMSVLPAKVAGVKSVIMTTPPGRDGRVNAALLVAAKEAGADAVFKLGGAQAVAAMCYGTQTIPKVNKVCGPGNIYVALAKKEIYGDCGIDMIAGPSEILIIADSGANPRFVAADLLSQAEHDPMARSILITTDASLAKSVDGEVGRQLALLPRETIAAESISSHGAILVVDTLDEALELSAAVAPEHLELCVENPFELLGKVRNAGACFLGHYSPEPLGDYYAGTNHTLPTGGTARFSSALSVDDFVRKTSIISYSREDLLLAATDIDRMADAEGLSAHARAISVRFED